MIIIQSKHKINTYIILILRETRRKDTTNPSNMTCHKWDPEVIVTDCAWAPHSTAFSRQVCPFSCAKQNPYTLCGRHCLIISHTDLRVYDQIDKMLLRFTPWKLRSWYQKKPQFSHYHGEIVGPNYVSFYLNDIHKSVNTMGKVSTLNYGTVIYTFLWLG